MKCATCGRESPLCVVSLTPEIHENMCPGCRESWTVHARRMGCPRQPALSLVYFRRWQDGARRVA